MGNTYPYGQEEAVGDGEMGREKFATYFRDSDTGLDYADSEVSCCPGQGGGFLSPDPTMNNVEASDPVRLGMPTLMPTVIR